jgi:hypothetical protein
MISDLSACFINLPPEKLDSEIVYALKRVLEFFQVDRCALLDALPGKSAWKITHLVSSQFAPSIPVDTELPRSMNPWAYDRLVNRGEVVVFSKAEPGRIVGRGRDLGDLCRHGPTLGDRQDA